jgi:hypothetical protein
MHRQRARTRRQHTQHNDADDDEEAYDVYDDDDYIEALAYHSEEAKDDSDDFVAVVFHEWQQAFEEGRNFESPGVHRDRQRRHLANQWGGSATGWQQIHTQIHMKHSRTGVHRDRRRRQAASGEEQ